MELCKFKEFWPGFGGAGTRSETEKSVGYMLLFLDGGGLKPFPESRFRESVVTGDPRAIGDNAVG